MKEENNISKTNHLRELIDTTNKIYSIEEKRFKELFFYQRVDNIGGQQRYLEYLDTTKNLYPAIHSIEVILRNRIDHILSRYNPHWIVKLYFQNNLDFKKSIDKVLNDIEGKESHTMTESLWNASPKKDEIHNTLVSRLNFGFWIVILFNEKTLSNIFNANLDFAKEIFPKLNARISANPSFFFSFLDNSTKKELLGISRNKQNKILKVETKTLILASFITSIRNRLYHCEFLFKRGKGITTRKSKITYYFDDRRNKIFSYLKIILEEFVEETR